MAKNGGIDDIRESFALPIIRARRVEVPPITNRDLGIALAGADECQQAAMFIHFAVDSDRGYWALQCRRIAEVMNDAQCNYVAGCLEVLVEHLRGIPQERAAREGVGDEAE